MKRDPSIACLWKNSSFRCHGRELANSSEAIPDPGLGTRKAPEKPRAWITSSPETRKTGRPKPNNQRDRTAGETELGIPAAGDTKSERFEQPGVTAAGGNPQPGKPAAGKPSKRRIPSAPRETEPENTRRSEPQPARPRNRRKRTAEETKQPKNSAADRNPSRRKQTARRFCQPEGIAQPEETTQPEEFSNPRKRPARPTVRRDRRAVGLRASEVELRRRACRWRWIDLSLRRWTTMSAGDVSGRTTRSRPTRFRGQRVHRGRGVSLQKQRGEGKRDPERAQGRADDGRIRSNGSRRSSGRRYNTRAASPCPRRGFDDGRVLAVIFGDVGVRRGRTAQDHREDACKLGDITANSAGACTSKAPSGSAGSSRARGLYFSTKGIVEVSKPKPFLLRHEAERRRRHQGLHVQKERQATWRRDGPRVRQGQAGRPSLRKCP